MTLAETGATIAFAAIAPLLVLLLYVFRALPWTKPGPWRLVVALAALASVMFIAAEVILLTQEGVEGLDPSHQLPLFVAILAAAAAAMVAYLEGARATERARRLALTDPLTGLRNRRAFEEALQVAYELPRPFSVLYLDLDGFKLVNDRLGHESGDKALQHVAAGLLRAVRSIDLVARLGGDEFAILLPSADSASAERVANRALEEFAAIRADHPDWSSLGASLGLATRLDAKNPAALLALADAAMYTAKRAGGHRIVAAARPG